jgi:hypothetical protein
MLYLISFEAAFLGIYLMRNIPVNTRGEKYRILSPCEAGISRSKYSKTELLPYNEHSQSSVVQRSDDGTSLASSAACYRASLYYITGSQSNKTHCIHREPLALCN